MIITPRSWRRAAAGGGTTLDWWEDFRSGTFTANGLVREAANADAVIVSATGLGFPASVVNVAKNIHNGELDLQEVANNLWPIPAVGSFVFLRTYVRNTLPNGAVTGDDHGIQSNIGDVKWAWLVNSGTAGTYYMDVASSAESNIRLASDMAKSEVQRIEWRLSRVTSTTGVTTFRIYNSAGTLLGENTRNLSSMTDALYRTARWGIAGLTGATYSGDGIHWGCLAARVSTNASDWIGAYPVGPEA